MKIAIIGVMGSGKTTCSEHIVDHYGFKRISLAEPVYWVVESLNNGFLTSEDIYFKKLHKYIQPPLTPEEADKLILGIRHTNFIPVDHPKPRRQLQWFGTDCVRNTIRETLWIDIMLHRVSLEPNTNFVIDDVRFPNELEAVSEAGFTTIKLEVSPEEQIRRLTKLYGNFDKSILTHGSESEIAKLKGDYTLNTDGPKEEAIKKLDEVVKGVM